MPYIKLLTVLAGLALLTACGGAALPKPEITDNDKTGDTAVPCDTNPFGSTCLADTNLDPRRVEIVTECTDDDSGELCEDAIEFVCDKNFRNPICVGIPKYDNLIEMERNTCLARTGSQEACNEEARITTCDASPFPANCTEPKYVMQRRIDCESMKNKSQCKPTEDLICGAGATDIFDPFCEGLPAYYDAREMACESGMPKRTDDDCKTTIARICTNGDIFDDFCTGLTGIDTMRVTACQTHGTDETDGHSTCATILIPLCLVANPFIHEGCDDVVGIDMGFRKTFCETSANAWNPKCMDGTHGTVVFYRTVACLDSPFNDLADPLCATDTGTEFQCGMNPFDSANPGCANLTDLPNIVEKYCETNDVADCPNVTTADWLGSFTTTPLATTPTTGTPKNEFLQTTGATIATGDLTAVAAAALTPDSLTINANDGVAFYQGYKGSASAFYAGIFETTDLGAPFTNAVAPSAEWNGQFQAVGGFSVNRDFVLEVGFGGMGDTAGSVEAFVQQVGSTYYLLKGNFNRQGVISATIRLSTFSNGDRTTIGGATLDGILTGLIGAEGAVGVFISNANAQGNYAGGFVAKPTAPDTEPLVVNHGDWLRDFFKAPPARLTATNPRRQFLAGGPAGLDTTGTVQVTIPNDGNLLLTLESARYKGKELGGTRDMADGVAGFFDDGETVSDTVGVYYAGLLSGTDLGAPLTQATGSVTWHGQIEAIRIGFGDIRKDFVLEITFGAKAGVADSVGSIEGIVQSGVGNSTNYYQLTGTYDAGGVITGEVIFGTFTGSLAEDNLATTVTPNGFLTGLIGAQGAVGAFISGTGTKDNIEGAANEGGYVGGFVAAPILSIPNYDTFVRHYEPQKNADNTKLLEGSLAAGRVNQFLRGKETGIQFPLSVDIHLHYDATGHFETVALKLDGDSVNGIGLVRAFAEAGHVREIHRSGILLGTDLGRPLTGNEMDANWSGKLYVTRHVNASDENKPIAIDLELAVNFSAGTIRTANAVTTAPNETVAINGTFGAGDFTLPAGIMGGTVSYNDGTSEHTGLPLIGLIGEDGAIGVFHGGEGALLPMAGGFIVKPPDDN